MKLTGLLMASAVLLSACAAGVGSGRSGGLATYDDLKAATAACAAKGGHLKLKRNGDIKYLDDYACEKT